MEDMRKNRYPLEQTLTTEEKECKSQNLFIHDTLVFDAFN